MGAPPQSSQPPLNDQSLHVRSGRRRILIDWSQVRLTPLCTFKISFSVGPGISPLDYKDSQLVAVWCNPRLSRYF